MGVVYIEYVLTSLVKLNEELAAVDSIEDGGRIIDREMGVLREIEETEERKAEEARRKGVSNIDQMDVPLLLLMYIV